MTIFNKNGLSQAQALTFKLGGDWKGSSGLTPCPVCQPERRKDQRALALRSHGATLLVFCHKSGCSFQNIFNVLGLRSDDVIMDYTVASEAKGYVLRNVCSASTNIYPQYVPAF